jgi:pimeloyl-ACP methyl ester carboxylesterase
MNEHVILLHGIWMRGFVLTGLARQLRTSGYVVQTFEYASVLHGVAAAAPRLRARMRATRADRVHLVGHSLGGVVAVEAARDDAGLPPGHVVCLGSPLNGSDAARHLGRIPGGALLTGASHATLCAGVAPWTGTRPVGVVAGRVPWGLGLVVGGLAGAHDGTVTVDETRLDGIADHCVVAATHTGLLFSDEALRQTLRFLADGHFDAASPGPGRKRTA